MDEVRRFCFVYFAQYTQADNLDGKPRGHGSYVENDYIIASVAGQVERVNKLVSVRPFRSK